MENGRAALASAGVTLVAQLEPLGVEPEAEHALALAIREALTNVLRHARAKRCDVRVERTDAAVRIIVQDDGVGGQDPEGAGLSGMRARMAEIGGVVTRDSVRGTRLELAVPIRRPVTACEALPS